MQRVFTIIVAPTLLILAVSVLAVVHASKDNNPSARSGAASFAPGEIARTTVDGTELKQGVQTLALLNKGTKLTVLEVKGDWLGGNVLVRGHHIKGWIHQRNLEKSVSNARRQVERRAPSPARVVVPAPRAKVAEAKPNATDAVESLANKFARLMADERDEKQSTNSPGSTGTRKSSDAGTSGRSPQVTQSPGARQALLDQLASEAKGEKGVAHRTGNNATVESPRRRSPVQAPAFPPQTAADNGTWQSAALSERIQIARIPEDLADLDAGQVIGHLTITGDQFTDRSLRNLEGLRIISLSIEAVNVSNPGLFHLTKVKGLYALRLWAPGVDDGGLATLAQLPNLERLDLDGTHIQGTGLEQVSGFEKLAKLTLGAWIRDPQIALLSNLPQLVELDLRSCQRLTDACIEPLAQLDHLRLLWLPTQLSAETRKAIRQRLPHCQFRS